MEERHRPGMPDYPIGVSKSDNSGSNSGNNEIDYTSHKNVPAVEGGSSSSGGTSSSAGSGSSRAPPISITRALLQFFLPLVIAWFGGIFADLL